MSNIVSSIYVTLYSTVILYNISKRVPRCDSLKCCAMLYRRFRSLYDSLMAVQQLLVVCLIPGRMEGVSYNYSFSVSPSAQSGRDGSKHQAVQEQSAGYVHSHTYTRLCIHPQTDKQTWTCQKDLEVKQNQNMSPPANITYLHTHLSEWINSMRLLPHPATTHLFRTAQASGGHALQGTTSKHPRIHMCLHVCNSWPTLHNIMPTSWATTCLCCFHYHWVSLCVFFFGTLGSFVLDL